ncbi:MAG: hypothetical protein Q9178_004924 [Gyalolechia marmorata]
MPNGRLVQDRPRHPNPPKPVAVTPVPANTTASTITTAVTAKDETYSDPFAGLQMSPPASPPSSDGEGHGNKRSPKEKQQKGSTELALKLAGNQPKDKQHKKKTELAPKLAGSAPLPAHVETRTHTQSPSQPVPPTVKKKVSFPKNLNRGLGTGYTPPEDDKGVRFSTSLVRGEGTSYNENVRPDASNFSISRRQSQDAIGSQLIPNERLNDNVMGVGAASGDQTTATELDVTSESDDSFTDVVNPIRIVETPEPGPRPNEFDLGYHGHPIHHPGRHNHLAGTTISKRPFGSTRVKVRDNPDDCISEVGDVTPSHASLETPNKRHNSISGRDTNFGGFSTLKRRGTATAPTYNHRGHQLRPRSIDTGVLGTSLRRSWPEPIFIWKDATTTPMPGRQNPAFALRERSDSQKNIQTSSRPVIAKSWQQQSKRKYQSPSVVDDAIDGAVRDDPILKRTYRDV